ncbi:MAG: hypothetical protein VX435_02850 [Planctomycetota bacterium]|nr:hypothetical protein [Planctomycetota bacterium]
MTSLRLYRLSVGLLVCWGLSGCGGEEVLQEQVSLDSSNLAAKFGGKGVKKTDSTAKSSKKRKKSKAKASGGGKSAGKSAGGQGGTPDMSKMMSGQGGQGQGGGSNAGNASSSTPDMSKMMSGQGGQGGQGGGGNASGAMPDMSKMMSGQGGQGGQGGSGGGSQGSPDMSMMRKGQGGEGGQGGAEAKGSGDFGSLLRGSQGGGDKDGDDDDENKSTPELAVNRFLDALERGEFEELKQVISNRATAASLRRLRAGTTSERELERLKKKYATGVYVMGVKRSPGRNELRVAIGKPATESTAGVQVADIVVRREVAEVWRVFAIRRASS